MRRNQISWSFLNNILHFLHVKKILKGKNSLSKRIEINFEFERAWRGKNTQRDLKIDYKRANTRNYFLVNNFKCVMQQKELEKGRELNDNLWCNQTKFFHSCSLSWVHFFWCKCIFLPQMWKEHKNKLIFNLFYFVLRVRFLVFFTRLLSKNYCKARKKKYLKLCVGCWEILFSCWVIKKFHLNISLFCASKSFH